MEQIKKEEATFFNTELKLKVKRLENMMLDVYKRIDNLQDKIELQENIIKLLQDSLEAAELENEKRIKAVESHLSAHNEKIIS
mgnify:CR=1 FL=1